jgi:hypothetical protein
MNALHEAFEQRAGSAGPPDLDLGELIGLGEQRLRRRRLITVLSVAAAIVIAAAAVGLTAQNGTGTSRPGPIEHPRRGETVSPRQIVYSDAEQGPDRHMGTIHLGDRMVEIGSGFVHLDVTDDGVVYSTGGYLDDGRVWFTDGGSPEQIGSDACAAPHGSGDTVVTGNAGSLAAWFDCTHGSPGALVVFDTSAGRELVRRQVARCGSSNPCYPEAIVGERVYFTRGSLEMSTGQVSEGRSYGQDVRNQPRGLVIGDSWQTGRPTDAIGQPFWVDGSRLVPVDKLWASEPVAAAAFDSVTQRPVRLRLPGGYQAEHDELGRGDFWLFEWLDDDTVALVGWDYAPRYGDIMTCRLSTGYCELTVPGHGPGRVVANSGLPG